MIIEKINYCYVVYFVLRGGGGAGGVNGFCSLSFPLLFSYHEDFDDDGALSPNPIGGS